MPYNLLDNSNFGLNFSSLKEASSQLGNDSLNTQVLPDWSSQFGVPSQANTTSALNNTATSQSPSWSDLAFGYKDADGTNYGGYLNTGLNLLKSGLNFYLGSQQLSQAEDALAENKRQFNLNYNAQKDLINDQLAWQYQARKDRNASNAGTLTQIS